MGENSLHQFLSSAVEQAFEGIAIADLQGILMYVNSAWTKMHGYDSSQNLIGESLKIFHNSEQLKKEVEPFNLLVQEKGANTGEVGHVQKDGTTFPTLMTTTLLKDKEGKPVALLGLAKEISEIKMTEKKLMESEARLQSIISAVPIGIGVVINRVLVEINKRICEMTGYTNDELVGKSARVLYPTQEEFEFVGRKKYRHIAVQGIGTVETQWVRKDGTLLDVLLSSSPINPDDLSVGVTFTATDITKRKQIEEELEKHHNNLEEVVKDRTDKLQQVVNLMAGRENRMAELKEVIIRLRKQLEEAEMTPVADDPLKEGLSSD